MVHEGGTMALDSAIEVLDPRFYGLVIHNAHVEHLWAGARWAEGPVYVPSSRQIIFSDIPNNRTLRYDERTGLVDIFDQPAFNANGHCLDLQGRIITAEHGGRSVSRINHDGIRQVLVEQYTDKRLNSPNDVVVKSDGSIWFSDPTYGIDSDYEGNAAESEIGASYVYRYDPDGTLEVAVSDMVRPNGLAFSPDEETLYVADTGISHVGASCPPDIRAYDVSADGRTLTGTYSTFAACTVGVFDGFRVDHKGNVWTSAGDGVHCFADDGELIGKIRIPEVVANVEFGGLKRNRLYICATTGLYSTYLNTRAAR
jgi:gluconolactonase